MMLSASNDLSNDQKIEMAALLLKNGEDTGFYEPYVKSIEEGYDYEFSEAWKIRRSDKKKVADVADYLRGTKLTNSQKRNIMELIYSASTARKYF